MTTNLLNGEGEPNALAALLDEFKPDVVGAQELSSNQAAVLEDFYSHGVARPRDDNEGNALMANVPIQVQVLTLAYRTALRGIIEHEGVDIEVISMHLANPVDGWRGKLPERRRQLADLHPILSRPGHRIVIGDMNSTPAWPAYRRLRDHLDDPIADLAAAENRKPQPTWGWRPGWPAMLRIDHILTQGFRAEAVAVRPIAGSDHRAVIADLQRH
jgi:endonuclease/exonuclease/phosphatase family metal-dependent hydrolase